MSMTRSLSARRAWIEILTIPESGIISSRRSPQGERGLKWLPGPPEHCGLSRSPQGERGLKFCRGILSRDLAPVALRKESVD